MLVTQHGCDTHLQDPLAHLALTVDAQREAADALHRLSHEVCDGRWVALGGGGYEIVDVVPRTWTHLTAIAAHRPSPCGRGPGGLAGPRAELTGRPAPLRMGDRRRTPPCGGGPGTSGYDPEDPVDRAVMATRQAVFPLHGLDACSTEPSSSERAERSASAATGGSADAWLRRRPSPQRHICP